MNANDIQAIAQDALSGRFVAEVEMNGPTLWLTVRHENQLEDHCAGQGQVVGQMTSALAALGINARLDYHHSGGFTCCCLTVAEIVEALAASTHD